MAGRAAAVVLASVTALALALALPLAARAQAQAPAPAPGMLTCPDAPAQVRSAQARDAALACDGALDAFTFMQPLGLHMPALVRIEIVEQLPPDLRADAVGCYAMDSRRTIVLTRERFMARGNWFGVPVSDALYRAVVAHEVTHAIVGCHVVERKLPTAAHEYVAYVAMFATMDADVRARAQQVNPGQGYDHDAQINDLQYAFDPMRFGLEAYRHWLRKADGADFLRRVLAGQVVSELLFN